MRNLIRIFLLGLCVPQMAMAQEADKAEVEKPEPEPTTQTEPVADPGVEEPADHTDAPQVSVTVQLKNGLEIRGSVSVAEALGWSAGKPLQFTPEGGQTTTLSAEQISGVTTDSQENPAPASSPAVREFDPDAYWITEYNQGRIIGKVGMRTGLIGTGVTIVGGTILFASLFDDATWRGDTSGLASGAAITAVGGVVILAGAPIAASGATRSHRALASGGVTEGGCKSCTLSWVSLASTPLTSFFGLGGAYVFAGSQIRMNHQKYLNAQSRQSVLPSLKLVPMWNEDTQGLVLAGEF